MSVSQCYNIKMVLYSKKKKKSLKNNQKKNPQAFICFTWWKHKHTSTQLRGTVTLRQINRTGPLHQHHSLISPSSSSSSTPLMYKTLLHLWVGNTPVRADTTDTTGCREKTEHTLLLCFTHRFLLKMTLIINTCKLR